MQTKTKLFVLLLVHASTSLADEVTMPTAKTVGPGAMPQEIAPIESPFEMPRLGRPSFGQREVSLDERGVKPNQAAPVTAVLQATIDELSTAGGGTLIVPTGEWRTGRLMLKSGVNLHLQPGAVLQFSGEIQDYLPPVFTRYEGLEIMGLGGLIYAHKQERIAITGSGVLRGPQGGPVREIRQGLSDQLVDPKSPITERIFDGRQGRHYLRPYFVCFVSCRDVLVEGVTIENGPMWNLVPIYCDRVVVRGVSIDSQGVGNGDGVNLDSCQNVLIEYCETNTGDDCYAIKAGRDTDGLRVDKPSQNIVIRKCYSSGGFGGVTCGSETAGVIRNVYVHDCLFEKVRHAVYFKTRRPRGGGGERILVERIAFNSSSHAVFFDMIGSHMYVGELGNRLPKRTPTPATPFYRDVTVRDIAGESTAGEAFKIKGIPESPAKNITLEAGKIRSRDLVNLTDADGVLVLNCQFFSEQPRLLLVDAYDVRFKNTDFQTQEGKPIRLESSDRSADSLHFENCQPENPVGNAAVPH